MVFTYKLTIQKHNKVYNLTGITESLPVGGHAIYNTLISLHAHGPYVKQLHCLTCGRYRVQIMFTSWLTKKNFYDLAAKALSEKWNRFVYCSFSSSSCPTVVTESHQPYFSQGDMDTS